jgi:hypothetical protein
MKIIPIQLIHSRSGFESPMANEWPRYWLRKELVCGVDVVEPVSETHLDARDARWETMRERAGRPTRESNGIRRARDTHSDWSASQCDGRTIPTSQSTASIGEACQEVERR